MLDGLQSDMRDAAYAAKVEAEKIIEKAQEGLERKVEDMTRKQCTKIMGEMLYPMEKQIVATNRGLKALAVASIATTAATTAALIMTNKRISRDEKTIREISAKINDNSARINSINSEVSYIWNRIYGKRCEQESDESHGSAHMEDDFCEVDEDDFTEG